MARKFDEYAIRTQVLESGYPPAIAYLVNDFRRRGCSLRVFSLGFLLAIVASLTVGIGAIVYAKNLALFDERVLSEVAAERIELKKKLLEELDKSGELGRQKRRELEGKARELLQSGGGAIWVPQDTGVVEDFSNVHFVDINTGWIVGRRGTIIKTTNGGETWTPQESATDSHFRDVFFANAEVGWAVGGDGVLARTTDGGRTWMSSPIGDGPTLYGVHFLDTMTGWVAGLSGQILNTTDGGKSWIKQTSDTEEDLIGIHILNADVGWVVGADGLILMTTDGGDRWSVQNVEIDAHLTDVHVFDPKNAVVIGWNGTVLRTTDGGEQWDVIPTGTEENLIRVSFANVEVGWAVGWSGTVIATSDGGKTWSKQFSATDRSLIGTYFVDARTGWATGTGGSVVSTTDYSSGTAPMSLDSLVDHIMSSPLRAAFLGSELHEEIRQQASEQDQRADERKALRDDIAALQSSATPAGATQETSQKNPANADKEWLGETTSIRLGILVLLGFFLQLLVSLYKYTARLAYYYDARADALVLTDARVDAFQELVQHLSPDGVDFGGRPQLPLTAALDIVKQVQRTK